MTLWQSLVIVSGMHLLAVVSPGPDFALMLRNGLAYDRKTALYTALGIASGIWVHVGYCLLGLALLMAQSPWILKGAKMAGGGYLAYLGAGTFFSKPSGLDFGSARTPGPSPWSSWKTGFLCNVLNPKATLFFLGLFTLVLKPGAPWTWQFLFGLEMSVATFAWFAFVAYAVTHPLARSRIERFQEVALKLVGAALVGMGIALIIKN